MVLRTTSRWSQQPLRNKMKKRHHRSTTTCLRTSRCCHCIFSTEQHDNYYRSDQEEDPKRNKSTERKVIPRGFPAGNDKCCDRPIPRNRATLLLLVMMTLLDFGNAYGVRSSRCCGLIPKNNLFKNHPTWKSPSRNNYIGGIWFLQPQSSSRTAVYDVETDAAAASMDMDLASSTTTTTVIMHPQLNHTTKRGVPLWSASREDPQSDHRRKAKQEDTESASQNLEQQQQQQTPNAEDNPSEHDTDDLTLPSFLEMEESNDDDVPHPTENGGYSHTKASRAKISAANRGKVPWNKGMTRSEEVKAKIAAGVRKKNRERFLQKLQNLGLTEEQYEQQKKEERRRKEAERRARLTEKGGYRATEETKQKISRILKEKYASGELQPRKLDPSKVRRGFTHSEETRRKISESLRKRWANDEEYRSKMQLSTRMVNSDMSVRQKISESLKMKWQDPEFRQDMLNKIANRTYPRNVQYDEEHRAKISAAMKAKWQDEEYRKKTQESIAKRRQSMPIRPKKERVNRTPPVRQPKQPQTKLEQENMEDGYESRHPADDKNGDDEPSLAVKPLQPLVTPRKKVLPQKLKAVSASKTTPRTSNTRNTSQPPTLGIEPVTPRPAPARRSSIPVPSPQRPTTRPARVKRLHDVDDDDEEEALFFKNDEYVDLMVSDSRFLKDLGHHDNDDDDDFLAPPKAVFKVSSSAASRSGADGNVDLLKQERRDLYDLLYGEEEEEEEEEHHHRLGSKQQQNSKTNGRHQQEFKDGHLNRNRRPSQFASLFDLEDEDLDSFDPYGLQDF